MKVPKVSCAMAILAGVLRASGADAQSYGDQDQVLTIGAAEFRSLDSSDAYVDAYGYLRWAGEDVYRAPVALPEGALIKRICFYADDSDPDSAMFVLSHLLAIKQVPGGESPAMKIIGDDFVSQNLGYHAVCGDMTAPVRGRIDVDGDGIPDAVAYYVHVYFPAFSNPLGVGGMRITWKRQVSDPPPTPTFGDVRASDLGFPYIEALVSSGITAGCSAPPPPAPPLYCPDANLTRRQMAVFLAKALGLHWAESAP